MISPYSIINIMQFEKERKIPLTNPFLVPFELGPCFTP